MRQRSTDLATSQPGHVLLPQVDSKGANIIVLTVTKKHPSQEVGISLGTVDGVLYVTSLSPSGLFVGKPILPGDTVLSINNYDFRKEPKVKDAYAVILNAPTTVTIEIKKTANREKDCYRDDEILQFMLEKKPSKRCRQGIFKWIDRSRSDFDSQNQFRNSSSFLRAKKSGDLSIAGSSKESFDLFYV